jgi:hypothetical protein
MKISDCITQRTSRRSFDGNALGEEHHRLLKDFITTQTDNPFKVKVRMALVDLKDPVVMVKLGTYGIVSGARTFMVGAVERAESDMECFGYNFERAVLYAQSLGLGTCWLGGTFTRGNFAKVMGVSMYEVVPCISPVGYPREKHSMKESLMRFFAGSQNRRPWPEIFFDHDFFTPLTEEQAGAYKDVLAMVRLAPSSTNKQPWRVVKSRDDGSFHFYVQHAGKAVAGIFGFDLQKVDLGIAMYHFEAVAREKGLAGHWVREKPDIKIPAGQGDTLEYLFSWKVS